MAQDIRLLGALYSAVPSVNLPKEGGGTATFTDVTDTTAAAADVAQGKYFYTAAGVKTEGTGSGGGGGVTVTDEPNATGITCVITSGGSPVPPTPETWETVYNGTVNWYKDTNNDYPYCWINDLSSVTIPNGSVWRVTYNNTEYVCTAHLTNGYVYIGNPKWAAEPDDGTDVPFAFLNAGYGAWMGNINLPNQDTQVQMKIERQAS